MSYIYFSMIESNVCLPNAALSIALKSAAFIDSCNQFCWNFYIIFGGWGGANLNLNSYNSMYNISVHFIVLNFFLLQHKDIILIHKSASVSAEPVFKLSSIRISIRITSIRISIASKHFLISIQWHASLAFIALPNLHICMLISFFEYNVYINKAHWCIFYNTTI